MKPRTTLLFLGAFLALLAYVYLGELRRRPAPDAEVAPTPAPLLSIAADEVVGITVRSGEQETRLARPAGGEWEIERHSPARPMRRA